MTEVTMAHKETEVSKSILFILLTGQELSDYVVFHCNINHVQYNIHGTFIIELTVVRYTSKDKLLIVQ